jgi:hypothetical protein
MGDNPAVTTGPPISLNWSYEQIPSLPIKEFENFRLAHPRAVDSHCLMITAENRREMLKRSGFTDPQIQNNEKRVLKIQMQRARTRMSLPIHLVEHAMRSAGRKIQRSRQSPSANGFQNAAKLSGQSAAGDVEGPDSPTVSTASSSSYMEEMLLGSGQW